jgi:Protein of unknown function (DUF1579)
MSPEPTPTHRRLADLVGAWSGKESLAASPWSPGGTADGRHVFSASCGGMAVVQDYVEHRDGDVSLTGHGVLTVDPETDDVLWYWFDAIGFPPAAPARGAFAADGRLTLEKTTPRGTQRATFALAGDTLDHQLAVRLRDATEFSTVLTARYAREA